MYLTGLEIMSNPLLHLKMEIVFFINKISEFLCSAEDIARVDLNVVAGQIMSFALVTCLKLRGLK